MPHVEQLFGAGRVQYVIDCGWEIEHCDFIPTIKFIDSKSTKTTKNTYPEQEQENSKEENILTWNPRIFFGLGSDLTIYVS